MQKKMRFLLYKVIAIVVLTVPQAVWGQAAPTTAEGFIDRGLTYYDKGDYDRAIADFTQALRLNPNNYGVYLFRGHSYIIKGDYDRGIADLDQSIKLNSNEAQTYLLRGTAYKDKKD